MNTLDLYLNFVPPAALVGLILAFLIIAITDKKERPKNGNQAKQVEKDIANGRPRPAETEEFFR